MTTYTFLLLCPDLVFHPSVQDRDSSRSSNTLYSCFISPFVLLFIFFLFFLAPCLLGCLSLPFSCAPLSWSLWSFPLRNFLFPSHLCVWLLSCSLSASALYLLPPPQAFLAKLGAAASLWCSMHF